MKSSARYFDDSGFKDTMNYLYLTTRMVFNSPLMRDDDGSLYIKVSKFIELYCRKISLKSEQKPQDLINNIL